MTTVTYDCYGQVANSQFSTPNSLVANNGETVYVNLKLLWLVETGSAKAILLTLHLKTGCGTFVVHIGLWETLIFVRHQAFIGRWREFLAKLLQFNLCIAAALDCGDPSIPIRFTMVVLTQVFGLSLFICRNRTLLDWAVLTRNLLARNLSARPSSRKQNPHTETKAEAKLLTLFQQISVFHHYIEALSFRKETSWCVYVHDNFLFQLCSRKKRTCWNLRVCHQTIITSD